MPTRHSAKSLRSPGFPLGAFGTLARTRSALRPLPEQGVPAAPVALLALLALLGLILPACSSTPKTQRLYPQTMSPTPPPESEALPGLDPREPVSRTLAEAISESGSESGSESEQDESPITVVIETGGSVQVSSRPSLVEAAAAERKRRETGRKSIAVVTNESLADFSGGQLTEMRGPQPTLRRGPAKPDSPRSAEPQAPAAGQSEKAAASPASVASVASETSIDPETYWRARILRARTRWASAVEETSYLEGKIAELRQRFYAEEDPYYRDSQIKPSWDRALDRLEETRTAIEQYRREVRTVLEEGRRASALPGWLREGLALEPDILVGRPEDRPRSPRSRRSPSEHIPGEPIVAPDPDDKRR